MKTIVSVKNALREILKAGKTQNVDALAKRLNVPKQTIVWLLEELKSETVELQQNIKSRKKWILKKF